MIGVGSLDLHKAFCADWLRAASCLIQWRRVVLWKNRRPGKLSKNIRQVEASRMPTHQEANGTFIVVRRLRVRLLIVETGVKGGQFPTLYVPFDNGMVVVLRGAVHALWY